MLTFFNEIELFEGLKELTARERDPSMRDEISISLKCMKAKLSKRKKNISCK